MSNIHIDGEKLLVLEDVLGLEKAKALAQEQKVKALGVLAGLLSRPKPEDIELVYEEKRYEAFWHVIGASHFEYKRRKIYHINLEPMVQDVELLGQTFQANQQKMEIQGIERCIEEYREELLINAQSGESGDFSRYLARNTRQVTSTDELTQDGTPIVDLQAKPAFLVRKVINTLIKAFQADQILDERIGIQELALYFIPVYTFEFHWKAKDKRIALSFDGATGEQRAQANKIVSKLRQNFTNDEIFEFGKEVANFVPGGGLAMMVGKKAIELTKKEK